MSPEMPSLPTAFYEVEGHVVALVHVAFEHLPPFSSDNTFVLAEQSNTGCAGVEREEDLNTTPHGMK